MRVITGELYHFRNYDAAQVALDPGINVITGENAQGKTNFLESIYYMTGGRSFRTRFDRELIQFGQEEAGIRLETESGGRTLKMEARLPRGGRKRIAVNGVKLKTAAELSGSLTAVLFCPEDLDLVQAGAARRRRLMDEAISQLKPLYADALAKFTRLYAHKTRILRDHWEKPDLLEALDPFNLQLCQVSAGLIRYRAAFVEKLMALAAEIHRDFSGGREALRLEYQTVSTVKDPLGSQKEIFEALMAHQAAHRQAEIASGQCLSGIHKDELEIYINDISARRFASQGQARTAALSIKLAEREIYYAQGGEYPVLLLDDVLSELDPKRQDFVLNRIGSGQVLITCCADDKISQKTGGRILTVAAGRIGEE